MCRWETIGKTSKVSFSRITFKEINFEIMLRIDLGLGTEASDKLLCFLCLGNLVIQLCIWRCFCKLHYRNMLDS